MRHPNPEIRILAEASLRSGHARDLVHACALAASQAGVDGLRVASTAALADEPLGAWIELRKSILRLDLDLVVTVASVADVEFIGAAGVGGLAVSTAPEGGGEPVWDAVGRSHLPVVVLSDPPDDPGLEAALATLLRYDIELTVLFGSPVRPASAERLGLGRVALEPPERRVSVGFADRSGSGWAALAACALGADVVELPVTLSPFLSGGEGAVSPEALQHIVKGLRYLAWARSHEDLRCAGAPPLR
jgi:hypothetical protein